MAFVSVVCPDCSHVGVVSCTRVPGVLACSVCHARTYHTRRRSRAEEDAAWRHYDGEQPRRSRKKLLAHAARC